MKCIQCNRIYEYNDEVGYSKEWCGPFCDGLWHGKKSAESELQQLRDDSEALRVLAEMQSRESDDVIALCCDENRILVARVDANLNLISAEKTPLAAVQAAKQKIEQEQG